MQRWEDNSKMDLTGIRWGQHKPDSPGFRQGQLANMVIKPSVLFNLLMPYDDYSGRTTPLTSKCCILYIYSTKLNTHLTGCYGLQIWSEHFREQKNFLPLLEMKVIQLKV